MEFVGQRRRDLTGEFSLGGKNSAGGKRRVKLRLRKLKDQSGDSYFPIRGKKYKIPADTRNLIINIKNQISKVSRQPRPKSARQVNRLQQQRAEILANTQILLTQLGRASVPLLKLLERELQVPRLELPRGELPRLPAAQVSGLLQGPQESQESGDKNSRVLAARKETEAYRALRGEIDALREKADRAKPADVEKLAKQISEKQSRLDLLESENRRYEEEKKQQQEKKQQAADKRLATISKKKQQELEEQRKLVERDVREHNERALQESAFEQSRNPQVLIVPKLRKVITEYDPDGNVRSYVSLIPKAPVSLDEPDEPLYDTEYLEAFEKPKSLEPVSESEDTTLGNGTNTEATDGALSDAQIIRICSRMPSFIDCVTRDEFETLDLDRNSGKNFAILNTGSSKEFEKNPNHIGHWVLVGVNHEEPTVYYFDPLAEEPHPEVAEAIRRYVAELPFKYQFKINRLPSQLDSNLCGYHCIRIMKKLDDGQTWKQATNFSSIYREENAAEKLKSHLAEYDFI